MDGFIGWLISSSLIIFIGEGLNCYYPYHDGEFQNEGMVCQWEQETFYYDEDTDKWILKEEDEDDNWIEVKSRKNYWKKRNDKGKKQCMG